MIEVESDKDGHNVWCKKCKGQVEWEECQDCEDGYSAHDCGEDTCCCVNQEKNVECQTCKRQEGWWRCYACEQKEKGVVKQYKDQLFKNKDKLFEDVFTEHRKQVSKWGIQTHTLFEWLNYTTEELGELAKAISEHQYRKGTLEDIYKEAIQVATLSLKIAEMVSKKRRK